MRDSVVIVEIRARAVRAFERRGTVYAAGDEVVLRVATGRYVTRPEDDPASTPSDVGLLELEVARNTLVDGEGWPRLGGSALPERGRLVVDNRGGRRLWWRHLSFTGGRVTVRRVRFAAPRQPEPLADAEVLWRGAGVGRARIGDQVEITLDDAFAAVLDRDAQPRRMLGLGSRLELDGVDDTGASPALPTVERFSLAVLVDDPGGAHQGTYAAWGDGNTGPGMLRRRDTGGGTWILRGRINGTTNSSFLAGQDLAGRGPTWVVVTYDGATSRLYTADATADDVVLEDEVTGAIGSPKSVDTVLRLGFDPGGFETEHFPGALADVRIYTEALDATRLADVLGRPLELDRPEDAADLLFWVPMNEGLGNVLGDVVNEEDVSFSGDPTWGSTLEGRPEQAGTPKPEVLPGEAELVPLVRVDRLATGDVYIATSGPAEVLTVYSPGLVPLVAGTEWTPIDRDGSTRGVLITVGGEGPFLADVRVTETGRLTAAMVGEEPVGTLAGQIHYLVVVLGDLPGRIPGAALDTSALGALAGASHALVLPPERKSVAEVLTEVLEPLGAVWGSANGEVLEVRRILPPAGVEGEIVRAPEVVDLEMIDLDTPPRSVEVAFAPVFYVVDPTAEVAAADPELVARSRAGRRRTAPAILPEAALLAWPDAADAEPLATGLRDLVDAEAVRDTARRLADGQLWSATVRGRNFSPGDELELFAGNPGADFDRRSGFEDGRDVVVVAVELDLARVGGDVVATFLVESTEDDG